MVLKVSALLVILSLLYLSLDHRVNRIRTYRWRTADTPVAPKESAFSLAVVELLSTAGGVYLALLLIRNFLQVDIPSKVIIIGLQLEPMAAVSLLIAICQPYILLLFRR